MVSITARLADRLLARIVPKTAAGDPPTMVPVVAEDPLAPCALRVGRGPRVAS